MLATSVKEAFDDPDWIFEIKWDGYRAVAEVEDGEVNLHSRNNLPFNHKFIPVAEALKDLGFDAVLDGELVILDESGRSRFQGIQNYQTTGEGNLVYYVFDILYLNGHDLTSLPLLKRKEILKEVLPELPGIIYSDHVEENGIDFFNAARDGGLEGIIAKDGRSPYRIGRRSREWLKIKTSMRQEAVIGGFTEPKGSRKAMGALVLGVYNDKGELDYIGHTGGGFDDEGLKQMHKRLEPYIQKECPFKVKPKTNARATWVKPELVCEVTFSEWTDAGTLRQPIFLAMREDKKAKEVKREIPEEIDEVPELKNAETMKDKNKAGKKKETAGKKKKTAPGGKTGKKKASAGGPDDMSVSAPKNLVERTGIGNNAVRKPKSSLSAGKKASEKEVTIEGITLKLTNLDKYYFPKDGYTKGDLIEYYEKISDYILPYLKGRPESLNRHPNGINGENFFQKNMGSALPDWIKSQEIFSEHNNAHINYMICDDLPTLIYMANLGCIEINPWFSTVENLTNPDYMVIDLDPEDISFNKVVETAIAVKEVLDEAKADAYCKTSGATGLHIYIPLGAKYDYEISKEFGHLIAQIVHRRIPSFTSIERSPSKRQKKVYLDYLQNRKGQTLAAPYSARPKPGATVATPLEWKEVKIGLDPGDFTIRTIFKRLEKKGDMFKPVLGKGVNIEKCIKNLEKM